MTAFRHTSSLMMVSPRVLAGGKAKEQYDKGDYKGAAGYYKKAIEAKGGQSDGFLFFRTENYKTFGSTQLKFHCQHFKKVAVARRWVRRTRRTRRCS